MAAALDKGWYVVTSDYEGLEAQYVAGTQSGHATLDSMRAVINAPDNGLSTQANSILWGYSGGALASEWAAELQPQYAPELKRNLRGVALGGLTPNTTNVLLSINQGPYVGIAFGGLIGLSKAYPGLGSYVNDHLLQDRKASFLAFGKLCIEQLLANTTNLDLFSFFRNGKKFLSDTIPSSILANEAQMGLHGVPKLPLFMYKAVGDQISPIGDTDDLYEKFCSEGVAVEYQKNLNGDHFTEAILGGPTAFHWITDRLTSLRAPNFGNCSTRCVNLTKADIAHSDSLDRDIVSYLQAELP